MKQLAAGLLALLPLAALAGPEPWSSIQAAGGLSVGPPFSSTDGWLLVVRANLRGPTRLNDTQANSAPACTRTQAVIEDRNIYLTVISGPVASKIASVCPAARIGRLPAGTYKVFYRGPNEAAVLLREVQFGS
jgi:hypothetical protein